MGSRLWQYRNVAISSMKQVVCANGQLGLDSPIGTPALPVNLSSTRHTISNPDDDDGDGDSTQFKAYQGNPGFCE